MQKLLLIISFVFITVGLHAQQAMNFQVLHTVPLGEFQENLMHRPTGISLEYLISPLKDKNLQVGASFSVSMYQNEDHQGSVDFGNSQNAIIETNEDDCFYTYQGIARYYAVDDTKLFRPYVQGQIGGATFFSSLSMLEDPEELYEAETRTHGTALLAGIGAGLAVKVFDGFYIDASVSYNESSTTTYRASPERIPNAQYRIDLSSHRERSKVNHVAVKMGMNMLF